MPYIFNHKNIPILCGILLIIIGGLCSFFWGSSQQTHLRIGETKSVNLPFELLLKDFHIQYTEGSEIPQDFHCQFIIIDQGIQTSGEVSSNHNFHYHGYKILQQGYDKDLQGCTLLVRYDSIGTSLVYLGYGILSLSLLIMLCRKNGLFRSLLRSLSFFAITLLPLTSFTQPLIISRTDADKFGELSIYYNNRIAPFDSYAQDYCRTVFSKGNQGYSPTQVVLNVYLFPEKWPTNTPQPALKLFPQENQWLSPEEYRHCTNSTDTLFVAHILDLLKISILDNDTAQTKNIIQAISIFQEKRCPAIDRKREKLEIFYNKSKIELFSSLCIIGLAIVSFILLLLKKNNAPGLIFLISSLILVFANLILRCHITAQTPFGNTHDTLLCLCFGIILISLITLRKLPLLAHIGMFFAGFVFLTTYLIIGDGFSSITPILQSPWLSIHVALTMTGYSFLAFTFLIAVVSIIHIFIKNNEIKTQKFTSLSRIFGILGIVFLAFGIMSGSVWANISWGSYWSWDPKETWALVTLIAYSITIWQSDKLIKSKALWYHIAMAASFFLLLITYFGVNIWFGGMHSYQ